MATIHLVLQGQDGVGKSLVAALIAQHRQKCGRALLCIDADPANRTLFSYGAFKTVATRLDFMINKRVNPRTIDFLIHLIQQRGDVDVVIDTGAFVFLPLSQYMVENGTASVLNDMGIQVLVHAVIVGSQGLVDSLEGLETLIERLPESAQIVIWLNEFFGAIELGGRPFWELEAYQRRRDRIRGLVAIEQRSESFVDDFKKIIESRQTFAEALDESRSELAWMSRVRLKKIMNGLYDQLDEVLGMGEGTLRG